MNLWHHVKHLFEKDDGSLPDIYVENLSSEETVAVYEWLMGQCEIAHNPKLWSVEEQLDVPIREVVNPARAFAEGRVETFRHCLAGLRSYGVALPELSVSVEADGLSFDYRMGKHWTERTVLALFELLRQVQRLAPQARIFQADEGGHSCPNVEFSEAFTAYVATHTDA